MLAARCAAVVSFVGAKKDVALKIAVGSRRCIGGRSAVVRRHKLDFIAVALTATSVRGLPRRRP
jgi:hypothetical protein